jgi:hypothetical protein
MRIRNWIIFSLVVGLVLVSVGCKPKIGQKCKAGAVVCGKDGALFCGDDSKYAALGCHGPAGCTGTGTSAACDASLALPGEGCETEGNIACSVDKKAQLDCKNHTWVVGATCKGAKGCEFKDEELFCDHTLADDKDPCHRDGQIACTNDRALIMKCQDHVFTPIDACRGPKSCTFQEHPERDLVEFDCDDSFANEGDPCNSEGFFACAVDKKSINTCRSKKFSVVKTCPGPKGCTVDADGQRLHCDQGAGGVFSGSGGGGKISTAAGGEKGAKAKPSATGSASAKTASSAPVAASASAKPTASAAASASAKPAASASASASAAPAGSASAKPAASVKPAASATLKVKK